MSTSVTFYPEGGVPRDTDGSGRLWAKIAGNLRDYAEAQGCPLVEPSYLNGPSPIANEENANMHKACGATYEVTQL